jgi:glyoxylase-like metal-dependent hydrolase (beta-lactamase superfamily II)
MIKLRRDGKYHAVEVTFLGTRGEIDATSHGHRRHSALLIAQNSARIMIDCGADWLRRLSAIAPTAIVLTHAHRDHAGGLAEGARCPVYATRQTLRLIRHFPIADPREIPLRRAVMIGGVKFEAYPVQHSVRAPSVGYRVLAGDVSFFYLPDVAKLPHPAATLHDVYVYIGDGATLKRPIIRRQRKILVGHAPITTQLEWCDRAHVQHAIFTHCGSQIVRGDGRSLGATLRSLGRKHGIDARFARDNDRLLLPTGILNKQIRGNA